MTCWWRAVAAAAFLIPIAARVAEPQAAPVPRVEAIRFEGVGALDDGVLRDAIVSRESRCRALLLAPVCALTDARWAEETAVLDTLEVRRDTERIRTTYAAWGYPDARATPEVVPRRGGSVDVVFRVAEGEPVRVRSVRVEGLDALPEAIPLPERLALRPGEPFAPLRVEATRRVLSARLAEAGYAFARVDAEVGGAAADGEVDVVVRVVPGPVAVFGGTAVLPGPPIRTADVERRLAYRPGERFRPSALEHTSERLYRLPVVGRVFVDPLPAAGADSVIVTTIGVTPRRVQGLQLGGAFSTSTCLEGNLGWGHRYLLGSPRTLTLSGSASNLFGRPLRRFPCTGVGEDEFAELAYVAAADFQEPVGADTWLVLGGEFSRITAPQAFIRRGVQLRVGVRHALTRTVDATLIVSPEQRDQLAAGPLFCGVHGVCGAEAIADVGRNAVLSPVQLSVGYTPPLARRPAAPPPPGPAWLHPEVPRWLFTGRVTAAGAGAVTGSEFSFGSLVVEASAVTGRGRATEAAARLRAGALLGADEPLPLHVRLFGGGPLGFRGVQANRLGPAVLTAAPADVEALGCAPIPGGCEGVVVDPRRVRLRPTGGNRLVEASVEARHWIHAQLQLAAFVDVGAVNAGPVPGAPVAGNASVAAWAPGVGVLALTGFGPLRGDVAFNPAGARRAPLLLRADAMGDQLVLGDVVFDPVRFDDPTPARQLWRRLQFHLSMGLPF